MMQIGKKCIITSRVNRKVGNRVDGYLDFTTKEYHIHLHFAKLGELLTCRSFKEIKLS